MWGQHHVGLAVHERRPRRPANAFSAVGVDHAGTGDAARAPARTPPSPPGRRGPARSRPRAPGRGAPATASSGIGRRPSPSDVSASGRKTASVVDAWTTGRMPSGTATMTSPAPARPPRARSAAPRRSSRESPPPPRDAGRPLVPSAAARGRTAAHVRRFGQPCGGRASGHRRTRCRRRGSRRRARPRAAARRPIFAAPNVTVSSLQTAVARDRARGAVDPAGDVDRDDRGPDAFSPSIAAAHASSGAPRNPVPTIASTATSARSSFAASLRVRADARRRRSHAEPVAASHPLAPVAASANTATRTPARARCRAATSPSPPLFPFPHTTTTRRPYAPPIGRRTRHGPAGALHQRGRGLPPPASRRPVPRLLRRQHRLHPSVTATANAIAFVFSWVTVSNTRDTPSASARPFALPARAIDGAPLGCRTTLMSCHSRPR